MIFSSRQLCARARTPSSVRLQHLFKEASCRYEQEAATAFIPEEKHNHVSMSYICYVYEKCDRFSFQLSPVLIYATVCEPFAKQSICEDILSPGMLPLLKLSQNVSGILYLVCGISFRVPVMKSLLLTSRFAFRKQPKVIQNQIR